MPNERDPEVEANDELVDEELERASGGAGGNGGAAGDEIMIYESEEYGAGGNGGDGNSSGV